MAARRQRKEASTVRPTVITLTIEDLSRSGAGVGRDDNGRAVFVPLTAPGDVVRVCLHKSKRRFAEGELQEILSLSPLRVEPRCAVYAQCGGCQWQHIPYDLQWQTKEAGVRESLRLAKVKPSAEWEGFPAQQVWAYRNRAQLRGKGDGIGFYARQSNTLVPIQRCEIVHPAINAVLPEVKAEGAQLGESYKVELSLERDDLVRRTWNNAHSASGFRQVNDEQNSALQQWIKASLQPAAGILDLYGGAGNLSISLQALAKEIHCIDVNIPDTNGVESPDGFYVHRSPVLPWLQKRVVAQKRNPVNMGGNKWIALIDPPRDGLGDEGVAIIQSLEDLQVTTTILVGCKSDPWARDVAQFVNRGWRLGKVAVFDFFPQTYHVESVALLVKTNGTLKRNK